MRLGWKSGRSSAIEAPLAMNGPIVRFYRRKSAFLVSGSEVLFLPKAFPGLADVTVYNGWFPALSRPISLVSALANTTTHLPAGDKLSGALTRPLLMGPPGGPDRDLRERIPSHVVAVASTGTPGKSPLAEIHLEGPNPYSLTGELIAWAAQHIATGYDITPGVVSPTEAFGLETLRQEREKIGLRVTQRDIARVT